MPTSAPSSLPTRAQKSLLLESQNSSRGRTKESKANHMGLLDQLWDDTIAGPPPLRKLRKYNSFSSSSSSSSAAAGQVSRSITILRTPASSPRSPSSPTSAPDSPVAPPGPRGDWKRLQRKSVPAAEGMQTVESRNPTVYDWVVISSLEK